MLGYGTLKVATASDSTDLVYETMRSPAEFRRAMLDQKMEFEQADARQISEAVRAAGAAGPAVAAAAAPVPPVTVPAPAAPAAPAAPTAEEKLRSLAKLRDDGLITAEDYEAKKVDLLEDL
jgi:hypothetical protein